MLTNSLLYYFFLVYLARSKRPNTPHFVFKRIVRNFEVRAVTKLSVILVWMRKANFYDNEKRETISNAY